MPRDKIKVSFLQCLNCLFSFGLVSFVICTFVRIWVRSYDSNLQYKESRHELLRQNIFSRKLILFFDNVVNCISGSLCSRFVRSSFSHVDRSSPIWTCPRQPICKHFQLVKEDRKSTHLTHNHHRFIEVPNKFYFRV